MRLKKIRDLQWKDFVRGFVRLTGTETVEIDVKNVSSRTFFTRGFLPFSCLSLSFSLLFFLSILSLLSVLIVCLDFMTNSTSMELFVNTFQTRSNRKISGKKCFILFIIH